MSNPVTTQVRPEALEAGQFHPLFLLLKRLPQGERPRLALINDFEILICDGSNLSLSVFAEARGIVTDIQANRGQIVEVFSKIDFVVNIILTNFVGPSCSLNDFDQIMDRIDLFQKIQLLTHYGILEKKVAGKFIGVKEVRNGFAHKWSEQDVTFEGKPISEREIFLKFRKNMDEIWKELVKLNQSIQPSVEELIEKLR